MAFARAVLVAAVLVAGAARAATPSSDARCQDAVAGAGRKLLERAGGILAACSRDVARGASSLGTNCLTDPATVTARAKAAAAALAPVGDRCTDASVAALAPAGDCRGA